MIKSKQGKINHTSLQLVPKAQQPTTTKKYDAVIKNVMCLFCKQTMYIESIYNSKCPCGSQWFEKLKTARARKIDAV